VKNTILNSLTTILVALAAAFVPASISAQTLVGLVFDAETEAPVPGATVALLDGAAAVVRTIDTDAAGSFVLESPSAGEFRIRVSRIGYQTYFSNGVVLTDGATTQVRILMGVNAIPLDPLTVLTEARATSGPLIGFEQRMENPSLQGFFVTREEIERRPVSTPTRLLMGAPGVTFQSIGTADAPGWQDRGMIYMQGARGDAVRPGSCLAQIFVNGVRMQQTPQNSLDDILDLSTLAGVEVYPRASSAPIEYQGTGECGVVLFWLQETVSSDRGWGVTRIIIGAGTILGLVFFGFRG